VARSSREALQEDQKEVAAGNYIFLALVDAELGYSLEDAKRGIAQGLALSSDRDARNAAALAWAITGETARSQKLLDELGRQYPKDFVLNQQWIPTARAVLAIRNNQPSEAARLLEPAIPYDLGAFPAGANMWPVYVRGKAYLAAHDGVKAAAEFQKFLDHRGIDVTNPLYPLSQLGLARALVMQGDTAKARTAYQDLFTMWKDADADLPVLKQAKAEYAKLQ
jgi:eukaryotic-like serine/threonine-protein kinase